MIIVTLFSYFISTLKNTNSLSETMKDFIEKISKKYEKRKFKNASV